MRNTLLCLIALGATAIAAAPNDAGSNDATLQQTAARQEQIRADSQLLVSRLDEVISEYTRNGLASGSDFEALKSVRDALGTLSNDEMEQVVNLLKGAAGDPSQMAKAYAGQKDISLRLKQILAEHELDQNIEALADGVRQLADRQSANLSTAIDTVQLAAQDQSANGQVAVTASEQAQQSEQSAIGAEAKLIAGKLIQIASNTKYIDAGLELQHIAPVSDTASSALGAGNMDAAATAEKTARQQLDEVARALMPAGAQEADPSRAAGELADLAHQQRALSTQTTRLSSLLKKTTDAETSDATDKALQDQLNSPNSPLARSLSAIGLNPTAPLDQIRDAPPVKAWLDARASAMKRQEQALRPQLTTLAVTQAALAAKTQMARDDLQNAPKETMAAMDAALAQMSSAQQFLAASNGGQAALQETAAASQLDKARLLAQQGNTSPAHPATPEQQLQQLQAGLKDLVARETASLQHGDALNSGSAAADLQDSLATKAQTLQQAAAAESSPSAQALQQAADAFRDAAQSMRAGNEGMRAEGAQQAALQSLTDAGRHLTQQAADIARQKQDLTAMQKQIAALGKLIQQQQQLGVATRRADPAKAKQLARLQASLGKTTQSLRQAVNTGTPDSAKALDQANTAIGDAAQQLDSGTADQAEPPQQAALSALYKAQDAVADRMQAVARSLGQSAAQSRAALTTALAKAQAAATTAQPALSTASAGPAVQFAAQQLSQAAGQPQSLPQPARDALRSAAQALAEAGAAAAAGQSQQAQSQAAQASQAIAAAQTALAADQAGIAALSPPPASQESQPGSPQQSADAAPASNSSTAQSQSAPSTTGSTGGSNGANEKNWNDQAGAPNIAANAPLGPGAFQGLPDRDRAAIQQSQSEKYPQEYGSMIEQYMRNLASDTGGK